MALLLLLGLAFAGHHIWAHWHYREAQKAMECRDFAGAQLVALVFQNHPDSVAVLEVLSLAYIQTYQLASAQECLRRWLEREPDRPEAWLLQAYVFQRLQNRGEALASYRRALELGPE